MNEQARCKHCKYWITNTAFLDDHEISLYWDDTGVCDLTLWDTTSGSAWIKLSRMAAITAEPLFDEPRIDLHFWLETRSDFGCVQFEALTPNAAP